MSIRWENPLPANFRKGRNPMLPLLALFKERPGEWGILREFAGDSTAFSERWRMASRAAEYLPEDRYEFRANRTAVKRGSILYARFLGPKDPADG